LRSPEEDIFCVFFFFLKKKKKKKKTLFVTPEIQGMSDEMDSTAPVPIQQQPELASAASVSPPPPAAAAVVAAAGKRAREEDESSGASGGAAPRPAPPTDEERAHVELVGDILALTSQNGCVPTRALPRLSLSRGRPLPQIYRPCLTLPPLARPQLRL
jgi:hypothetical protein